MREALGRIMETFYLGTHKPNWLDQTNVPLFVSHRTLSIRKSFPLASCRYAVDSGGFSQLTMYNDYQESAKEYSNWIRFYRDEIGIMDFAAPQDWMCEPIMLAKTGLTIQEHQKRTINNYLELRQIAPDLPFIPVLQGWTLDDYCRCIDEYYKAGIELHSLPTVGLGSVCRRQGGEEVQEIIDSIAAFTIPIHAFGVKTLGLELSSESLRSSDSMAWSFKARHRRPLPGCMHQNCANCLTYALHWRAVLLHNIYLIENDLVA